MWTTVVVLWMSQAAPLVEVDDVDEPAFDDDEVDEELSVEVDLLDELSELLEVLSAGFLSDDVLAAFLPESRLSVR